MDVSDLQVSDEDGYLIRDMMIKANSKIVNEQIWDQSCHQRDNFSAFGSALTPS